MKLIRNSIIFAILAFIAIINTFSFVETKPAQQDIIKTIPYENNAQ